MYIYIDAKSSVCVWIPWVLWYCWLDDSQGIQPHTQQYPEVHLGRSLRSWSNLERSPGTWHQVKQTVKLVQHSIGCIPPPRPLIMQTLFWSSDEGCKIASCVAPQTWRLQVFRSGVRWPSFLLNHFRAVLMQTLLSDV